MGPEIETFLGPEKGTSVASDNWAQKVEDAGRGGLSKNLISSPLSLKNTYQMNLISAGSISLEGTFKFPDLHVPG